MVAKRFSRHASATRPWASVAIVESGRRFLVAHERGAVRDDSIVLPGERKQMGRAVLEDHVVAVDEAEPVAARDLDACVPRPGHATVADAEQPQSLVLDAGEQLLDRGVRPVVDDDQLHVAAPLSQRAR